NALGAWWVIAELGMVSLNNGIETLWQELGDRILPVEITANAGRPNRVAMTQSSPVFGGKLTYSTSLAQVIGLDVAELQVAGLEPQAVSTGATHLLTPVKSLGALSRVRINPDKLIELVRPLGAQGCYLYSLETRESGSVAHSRAFFPGIGISEDPATGSAAGPLAAHLASKDLFKQNSWTIIEQGDEMGRPSRIEVRVNGDIVQVAGKSVKVAEGTLRL